MIHPVLMPRSHRPDASALESLIILRHEITYTSSVAGQISGTRRLWRKGG